MNNSYYFLEPAEQRYFLRLFDINCVEDEDPKFDFITFIQFQTICQESKKFTKMILSSSLENIKRQVKKDIRTKDTDIEIYRNDYLQFLEMIYKDCDRVLNEKDPEFKELYDLLSDNKTLKTKTLIEIIQSFDLPIDFKQFLGEYYNKEDLTFSDFCSLFKSNRYGADLILTTFTSSFYNANAQTFYNQPSKDTFPIELNR